MQPAEQHRITSYGLDRSVVAWVFRPETVADVGEALDFARTKKLSVCPAGGRNSFGDVFLLGDHVSLDMRALRRVVSFDREAGRMTVEGGTLDRDVIARALPCGFHLPALAGSLWNTVAGDLSSNINGKDSWKAGSFGDQVDSFTLMLADGTLRRVDRQSDAPLFAAVGGGLGLLGVVVEVTLRLQRVPSATLQQSSVPVADVAELIDRFAALEPEAADFAYAWVDGFADGAALGRGVFESARFVADSKTLSAAVLEQRLSPRTRVLGMTPETFWRLVRAGWNTLYAVGGHVTAFRAMNAVKYGRARLRGEHRRTVPLPDYQYPMVNLFPQWNLKFAPDGFNELHALFAADRFEPALRALLACCRRRRRLPELCAVRRHRSDDHDLSFASDGLSVTLPYWLAGFSAAELATFRAELEDIVLAHGGKIYLAKFPYLSPAGFRQMYPRYDNFLAVKERVDPRRSFWSDAAERLFAEGRSPKGAAIP